MFKMINLAVQDGRIDPPNRESEMLVLDQAAIIQAKGELVIQENKKTGDVYIIDTHKPHDGSYTSVELDFHYTKKDGSGYFFIKDVASFLGEDRSPGTMVASLGVTDNGAVFGIYHADQDQEAQLLIIFDKKVYLVQSGLNPQSLYKEGVFVKNIVKCTSTGRPIDTQVEQVDVSCFWLHLSSPLKEKDGVLFVRSKRSRMNENQAPYFGKAVGVFHSYWPRKRLVDYHIDHQLSYVDHEGHDTYSVRIERSTRIPDDPRFFETDETIVTLKIKNRPCVPEPHQFTEWTVSKAPFIFPNQS